MTSYTRTQIVELLHVDDGFVALLEEEEIVFVDEPEAMPDTYSERMLERVRVADTLVHELEIDLAGVAIIVRMREEMATLRQALVRALAGGGPAR